MVRTVLVELALFLTPFVVYGAVLLATRGSVLPEHWSVTALSVVVVAALALAIAGLVLFERGSTAPAGSRYVPAHMENGVFVPGRFE